MSIVCHGLVSFGFVVSCRVEPCRVRSRVSLSFACVLGWLHLVVALDVRFSSYVVGRVIFLFVASGVASLVVMAVYVVTFD